MYLPYLVIDTSSPNINVAIFANNSCLGLLNTASFSTMPSTYMVPEITAMLKKHNMNFPDLKFVGVINGPGYFTSLRLGLTYAKMLHLSLNIPIVTVNTLDGLAQEGAIYNNTGFMIAAFNIGKEGAVIGIYDQKLHLIKDQFYLGASEIDKIESIQALRASEKIVVLGNKQYMIQSAQLKLLYKPEIQYPSISIVANLALQKYNNKDFTEHLNTIYVGS